MDRETQIRILIAPFFFFTSLLTGLICAPCWTYNVKVLLDKLLPIPLQQAGPIGHLAVAVVAFLVFASLPVGFLISSITLFVLRVRYNWSDAAYYTELPEGDINMIMNRLGADQFYAGILAGHSGSLFSGHWPGKRLLRCAIVALDHGMIYNRAEGLRRWIGRAYTGYMLSANSACAIALSWVVLGFIIKYSRFQSPGWPWWAITGIILLFLFGNAWSERNACILMARFFLHTDVCSDWHRHPIA